MPIYDKVSNDAADCANEKLSLVDPNLGGDIGIEVVQPTVHR